MVAEKNPEVKNQSIRPPPRKTYRLSFGGLMTALIILLLYLAAVSPGLNLTFFVMTSVCLLVAADQISIRAAWLVLLAGAAASIALSGWISVWPFLLFFGPYPLLSRYLAQCWPRPFAWLFRCLFFNAAVLATVWLLPLHIDAIRARIGWLFWLLPVGLQVGFFLYHFALDILLTAIRRLFYR